MRSNILKRAASFLLVAAMLAAMALNAAVLSGAAATSFTKVNYLQSDSRWRYLKYNNSYMQASGCGILSIVNAVYNCTGNFIEPKTVADWAYAAKYFNQSASGGGGICNEAVFSKAAENFGATYGFKYVGGGSGSATSTTLQDHVANVGTAVVHVYGHYMALVEYNAATGQFLVFDCAPGSGSNYNSINRRNLTTAGGDWKTVAQLSTGTTSSNKIKIDRYWLYAPTNASTTPGTQDTDSTGYPFPTRDLYYNASAIMSGDDVKWVQTVLQRLGYPVTVDGFFGPGTDTQVKAYQSLYGITPNGRVEIVTRTALKLSLGMLDDGTITPTTSTTYDYTVTVPSTSSLKGTSASYTGAQNVNSALTDSENGTYAAFQPGGTNPQKAYKVTMDYALRTTVATDGYHNSDHGVILAMLGSGKTMGYNFFTGKYFIANAGGGWGGDPSDYVVQNDGSVAPDNFYRFEYIVEANRLTLAVNGVTVASATVSGAFSADQFFIFYPKHVSLDVLYTKMEYLDGSSTLSTGSGSASMTGWNGMGAAWTQTSDVYNVTFAPGAAQRSYTANVPSTASYAGTTVNYTGAVNVDSSRTTSDGSLSTYVNYAPAEENPTKPYKVTMDLVYNSAVATDPYRNSDQGVILVMLGSGKTMGYNFARGKYFIANGGGGWSGDPTDYVVQNAGSVSPGNFYRFEYTVEANRLSLAVNGVTVASADVSGAFASGDYIIFYPKHVNMDILFTKFEYLDGSASPITGSGKDALHDWEGALDPYSAISDGFSVTFEPVAVTTYTVSFNMNGHGTQIASQSVVAGAKATQPSAPSASGYTFGGWYTNAACTSAFNFSTAINANTTLYAKWTAVHVHTLSHVAAVAPSCTAAGRAEYWRCTGCSKIFSDSAATHETTVAALTLGALGHNFENGACTRCGAADPDYVPPVIPGDVDGDGHVNARDVMAIMHHLVGDTPTMFDLAAADFNGDGKINNRDVLSMMIAIVNSAL